MRALLPLLLILTVPSVVLAAGITFENVAQAEGSAVTSVPGASELSISGAILVIPGNPRFAFNGNSTGSGPGGIDDCNSGQSISYNGAVLDTIVLTWAYAVDGVSIEGLDFEVGSITESVEVRVYDAVSGGTLLHTTTLSGGDAGTGDGARTLIDLSTGYTGTDLVRRVEIENLAVNPAAQISGIGFDNLCYIESPVATATASWGAVKATF